MARLRFCGFDYEARSGTAITGSGTYAYGVNLDSDFLFVAAFSDTTFFAPGVSNSVVVSPGRNAASGALGPLIGSSGTNITAYGNFGCAVPRAAIGNPQEIWATFDISQAVNKNVNDPATLERAEARCQIFKFGDLSLRLRSITNYTDTADLTFEAFNGATSLGTITVVSYTSLSWMFVRVYAKLHAITGRFDVAIDGQSASYGSLNSVATTPLASVTHLYFSGGVLGVTTGSNLFQLGAIDNLLLDSTNFPVGRPSGRRVAIASDGTLSGWASTVGGTLTSALITGDSGFARGTNNGSTALLNLTAPSTAGLNGVLGWQLHSYGISNVDTISTKKLRTGVDVSGAVTNGTYVASLTPPATPSTLTPTYIDTLFYSSGSTDFTLAGVPNTKLRLEVIS
jgi:hypothetical protein